MRIARTLSLTSLVLLLSAPFCLAEPPETGFKPIFDGKTLDGWQGEKGYWRVEDGAIVMNAKDEKGKGGIRDLYTTEKFGNDFVLKMQFKAGPKADSGVYIRGPQLQIRDFIRRGEQKQLKKFKNDEKKVSSTEKVQVCHSCVL